MNFISEWCKNPAGEINKIVHYCRKFIHPENNKEYTLYCRSFHKNVWDFCFWKEDENGIFEDFETLQNNFKLINKNNNVHNIAEKLLHERFN